MATMPLYGKNHSQQFLFQNHLPDMADIFHKAYGAPPYIKQLKSFLLDNKQTLSGLGKVGKNF